MIQNVLVFPCGSEVGLEVHKSLALSTHFKVFGGSSVKDHGSFVYKNYIEGIPFVDDPEFTATLNKVIKDNHINYIIPAHDSVVLKLAQESANNKLACEVITSDIQTCELTRSKLKTYKHLAGIIPTPRIYNSVQDVKKTDLPVFLKPDVGQGSKGAHLAKTLEDVAFYYAKHPNIIILENLPGKEYTIDCFTNKDGELLFSKGRIRARISNGISVNSSYIEDPRFAQLARKINQHIVFRGVWFFQVKENKDGEFVLMEIASRIAGTMGLARSIGLNLVILSLFDAMGYKTEILENGYKMIVDRALENKYKHDITYKHVYLDFDDLVIFDNKVNPNVIAFVFQCINKGIKVHLLTKHKDDLKVTLEKYRLSNIFDEVIWLETKDQKHTFIKEKEAIFIDDSFLERKEVNSIHNIPVFDAHMIESLMERF